MDVVDENGGGFSCVWLWRYGQDIIMENSSSCYKITWGEFSMLHLAPLQQLFFHGGGQPHSRFDIPLNAEEGDNCNINRRSHLGDLIKRARQMI